MPTSRLNKVGDRMITVIHTMADGSVRATIDGYDIPYNKETSVAYGLLLKWTLDKQGKENTAHSTKEVLAYD